MDYEEKKAPTEKYKLFITETYSFTYRGSPVNLIYKKPKEGVSLSLGISRDLLTEGGKLVAQIAGIAFNEPQKDRAKFRRRLSSLVKTDVLVALSGDISEKKKDYPLIGNLFETIDTSE